MNTKNVFIMYEHKLRARQETLRLSTGQISLKG